MNEDKTYYTEDEIKKLDIITIRNLARDIGVYPIYPKNKEELIRAYLDIAAGKELPPPARRGRPVGSRSSKALPVKVEQPALLDEKPELKKKVFDRAVFYDDHGKPSAQKPSLEGLEIKWGVLELSTEGYGFLRADNCEYGEKDCYVPARFIRAVGLRQGDKVLGLARKNVENKPPALVALTSVNDELPLDLKKRPVFDNLVPIYPDERIRLEMKEGKSDFAIRCIDLVAPIGKGQRAMIVSPPKAGKTTLLKKIANSIAVNYPDILLFVLLVDERPEEVTDMQRSIKGEVIYSTFDETPEHHCRAAELLIERAKRNVELGKDVVVIMDSLTRLARAYNVTVAPSGRTLSGGIDPSSLHSPKRFFGSARNIEHGGSLTIIATALIDTGSRMDDVIYEEFKGTGNMEIHLDRKLSERRIFPAIDLNRSSTRREDLLMTQKELHGALAMRRMLSGDNTDATEQMLNMLMRTKNNNEFIDNVLMNMRALQNKGFRVIDNGAKG